MSRGVRILLTVLAVIVGLVLFGFLIPLNDVGIFGYVRGYLAATMAFGDGDYYVLDAARMPREKSISPSARLDASICWTSSPSWLIEVMERRQREAVDVWELLGEAQPTMTLLNFPGGIDDPVHAYVTCESDDGAPFHFIMAAAAPSTINPYYIQAFNNRMMAKIVDRYPSSRVDN